MTYKKNQTISDEGHSYLHIDYENTSIYDNTGTVEGPPIVEGHRYDEKK